MVIQQTTSRTKSRMNTSEQTLSMNSKQAITNSHFTSQTASPTQNYTNQIERSLLLEETKSTLPQSSIYGTGTSLTGSTIISNNSNTTKYLANSSQLSKGITELLINQTEYSVPISSYLQNNNVSIANMHQTKTDKDIVQNILNISTSRTSHLASYFSTFASIATLRTSLSKTQFLYMVVCLPRLKLLFPPRFQNTSLEQNPLLLSQILGVSIIRRV